MPQFAEFSGRRFSLACPVRARICFFKSMCAKSLRLSSRSRLAFRHAPCVKVFPSETRHSLITREERLSAESCCGAFQQHPHSPRGGCGGSSTTARRWFAHHRPFSEREE